MSEKLISPADAKRNEVMASFLGDQYKLRENIKEVWLDKNTGTSMCLRINGIFYDIVTKTQDGQIAMVKEGLSSKPSALCVVLGRVVEGESGEGVCKFDWEKLSDDAKAPSQRKLMTGEYSMEDGSLRIRWDDDMALLVSSMSVMRDDKSGYDPVFVRVTHGALNEEQGKILKSAVDAYILRCRKKLNPQEPKARKPRKKKDTPVDVGAKGK